jgi:hypothetical protein
VAKPPASCRAGAAGRRRPIAEQGIEEREHRWDQQVLTEPAGLLTAGHRDGVEAMLRGGGHGAGEQLGMMAGVGVGEQEPGGVDGVRWAGAYPQSVQLPGPTLGERTGGEQRQARLRRRPLRDESGGGIGRAVVDHPHAGGRGLCQETVQTLRNVIFFVTYRE